MAWHRQGDKPFIRTNDGILTDARIYASLGLNKLNLLSVVIYNPIRISDQE